MSEIQLKLPGAVAQYHMEPAVRVVNNAFSFIDRFKAKKANKSDGVTQYDQAVQLYPELIKLHTLAHYVGFASQNPNSINALPPHVVQAFRADLYSLWHQQNPGQTAEFYQTWGHIRTPETDLKDAQTLTPAQYCANPKRPIFPIEVFNLLQPQVVNLVQTEGFKAYYTQRESLPSDESRRQFDIFVYFKFYDNPVRNTLLHDMKTLTRDAFLQKHGTNWQDTTYVPNPLMEAFNKSYN